MSDGGGERAAVAVESTSVGARKDPEVGGNRQVRRTVVDPARLAAVDSTGLLDTDAEAVFDRLTRLAVRLIGVPAAFISLVDEHRDFYKSACGFGEPLASARELAGPTFCHYAIQSTAPLVIPDTAADPTYRDVPTVRSLGVAAYVGVPLVVNGQPVGSFCVIDTRPRAWTPDELEVLTELAAAAQREVELRVGLRVAEATNQQLQEQAAELEAQSEELQATAAHLEEQTELADALRRVAEQAGARMAGVLEAMADAYFALDADFRISAVNAAMERNVGLPRVTLLGRSMWEAFPGTVGNIFERSYRSAATEGEAAHFTHDYSDGRLELLTEVDVYPAEGGGVVVFWRDVTARERLFNDAQVARREAEAARAEAESARRVAEEASTAKSEFLAVMSHELRTPLNAIGGYAELIEMGIRGPVTHEQRDDLARIQKSQRHLLGLINGVLDYSRAEAGAVHYDVGDVPLGAVLASSEMLVSPQARAKRIALHLGPCIESLSARADREKLQQIVVNLLSNAVKFTADGGRVSVTCGWDESQGDEPRVVVRVADTGRGIAADALDRVFEPFVQVDTRLTRTGEGMGLGLAISRDLARGMGGDLTAESTPGIGSTFTLTLPAA